VDDGYVLVSSDIELNEAKLQQELHEKLNNALGGKLNEEDTSFAL